MAYISTRLTNSGTYLVNGSFDEFTGIPVVNNSLVLWLDAGQPTSYSGSGATWTDLSGNGYNGTLTGSPTYSSNNTGGALTFNGSSQYVTMAGLASSAFTSITLSIWVNASITVGSGSFITKELCYKYRLEPSGSIGLLIGTGAAWSLVTTFPAYTYTAGTWVNVAVTVKSTVKKRAKGDMFMPSAGIPGPEGWSAQAAAPRLATLPMTRPYCPGATAPVSSTTRAPAPRIMSGMAFQRSAALMALLPPAGPPAP